MTSSQRLSRIALTLVSAALLVLGCGDSGHSLGSGTGAGGGGTTGAGGATPGASGHGGSGGGNAAGAGGSTTGAGGASPGISGGGRGGSAAGIGGGAPGASAGSACSDEVPCRQGLFCERDTVAACNAGTPSGHCIPPPELCPANFAPVCGCDGRTYSNDCARQGYSVHRDPSNACASAGGSGGRGGSGGNSGAGGNGGGPG